MISLVTDSTSDLPPALAAKHSIHVVPTNLIVDETSYEDGMGFTREDFYARLPQMSPPPTTAAPSSGTFEQLYADLFSQGAEQVISIHAASQLTAIYNVARIAAEPYEDRIQVLDSGSLTLGLGFQALAAAEAIAEGSSLPEILHILEDVRRRVRVIAMLDTLEYLRRSGRVSTLRAALGEALRLRLFVEVRDGQVIPLERARTRKKAVARLGEILQSFGPLERFAMLHTNAETDAREFIRQHHPDALLINVTPVIGAHVGPNALGFAFVVSKQ
jgi:DegV family protein with EDD domain